MENKKDQYRESDPVDENKNIKRVDEDKDDEIKEDRFAKIGEKQAGKNNIEEEAKGSDADRSI